MAKMKMVVRVSMEDCKARSKALKICVSFSGVESASLKGETVEVVGVGVDPVKLTRKLRKCMPCTDLLSVNEVKEEKKEEKKAPAAPNKEVALPLVNWVPYDRCPPYCYGYGYPVCCEPAPSCAIL